MDEFTIALRVAQVFASLCLILGALVFNAVSVKRIIKYCRITKECTHQSGVCVFAIDREKTEPIDINKEVIGLLISYILAGCTGAMGISWVLDGVYANYSVGPKNAFCAFCIGGMSLLLLYSCGIVGITVYIVGGPKGIKRCRDIVRMDRACQSCLCVLTGDGEVFESVEICGGMLTLFVINGIVGFMYVIGMLWMGYVCIGNTSIHGYIASGVGGALVTTSLYEATVGSLVVGTKIICCGLHSNHVGDDSGLTEIQNET